MAHAAFGDKKTKDLKNFYFDLIEHISSKEYYSNLMEYIEEKKENEKKKHEDFLTKIKEGKEKHEEIIHNIEEEEINHQEILNDIKKEKEKYREDYLGLMNDCLNFLNFEKSNDIMKKKGNIFAALGDIAFNLKEADLAKKLYFAAADFFNKAKYSLDSYKKLKIGMISVVVENALQHTDMINKKELIKDLSFYLAGNKEYLCDINKPDYALYSV